MSVCLEIEKSTHICPVVPVVLVKHPDPETHSLSTVQIEGYSYVANTKEWEGKTKAVYIPPDSLVDTERPEFAFLALQHSKKLYDVDGKKTYHRVKAKKIRGVISFGLMVPVPDDTPLDEDWSERLGIIHYDPDVYEAAKGGNKSGIKMTGGEVASSPQDVYHVKYDIDNLRNYVNKGMFTNGEPVWVSEKIHGANGKFVGDKYGKIHCGSRTEWKKEYASKPNVDEIEKNIREKLAKSPLSSEQVEEQVTKVKTKFDNWKPSQNMWWRILKENPSIEKFCLDNPGKVLYGEVYGQVQDLKYGTKDGAIKFAAFDILDNGRWYDVEEFITTCDRYHIPRVPTLAIGFSYDFDEMCKMAEGQSTIAEHVREGCVIKPMKNREHPKFGRVCLKLVGGGYLERA